MVKPDRCPNSSPTTRIETAPATTIGHNSTPQNDFLIAGRLRLPRTLWGPARSAGPLFHGER